jgi:4a-hydroxytetrahydrobiopterin dehydratase
MWTTTDQGLTADFVFADFKQAFTFMTAVAFEAEKLGHHPQWTNTYNRVSFLLNTHDAGGAITTRDHDLAAAIDRVYQSVAPRV